MPYVPELVGNDTFLYINNNSVIIDKDSSLALFPVSSFVDFDGVVTFNSYSNFSIDSVSIQNGAVYSFKPAIDKYNYLLEAELFNQSKLAVDLQFTLFPVVHIRHWEQEILDEPKILAYIEINDPATGYCEGEYCGVELRGRSAQAYDKKSYGIQIYKKESEEGKSVSLLGIASNDDWILNASFMDQSNGRNNVSFGLWRAIQEDRLERGVKVLTSWIDTRTIELFVNNAYKGVYSFSDKTNRSLLDYNELGIDVAAVYKGAEWGDATQFNGVSDTVGVCGVWDGWENKSMEREPHWAPIYKFVDFVSNASNSVFSDSIAEYLNINQAIDYFILMNVVMGTDNYGKNTFMVQDASDSIFYICPWDLDATWGRDWKGMEVKPEGIISYNLYRRLLADKVGFKTQLQERWAELRVHVVTPESLACLWNNHYDIFLESNAWQREQRFWPNSIADPILEKSYINQWIKARISYLDLYFNWTGM